jgi:hypothetical protein
MLVFGLMLSIAAAQQQAVEQESRQKLSAAEVARSIADLDHDDFARRKQATEALVKHGEPGLEALRAALEKTESAEARLRLQKIIEEIEIWGGEPHDLKLAELLDVSHKIVEAKGKDEAGKARMAVLLTRWLRVLGEASGKPKLEPPVKFADVQPSTEDTSIRKSLVVGKNIGRISIARDSIILSDGAVEISSVSNCLIVARMGANISSCDNSVVITGIALEAAIPKNSVLISGIHLNARIAQDSILAAGELTDSGILKNVTFVNVTPQNRGIERDSRYVTIPRLILSDPQRVDPLAGVATITYLSRDLALFRLADGTGEYVARKDQPIRHPDGRPIDAFAGWKLSYVAGSRIAVFAKDDEFGILRWER